MAKWGEGDPRWIVEERADATNVNNWHWTEKNATNWSKEKIRELLTSIRVENNEFECRVKDVSKCEGEASANNRKAKLIFFYEWNIAGDWEGTIKNSDNKTVYKGTFEVPNLSEENDPSELDVSIYIKESKQDKLKEFMRQEGAARIQEALGKYVFLLKEEYSQGLILPTKDAAQANGKPAPAVKPAAVALKTTSSSALTNGAAASGQNELVCKKLTMNEEFKCRASELYQVFVNVDMVKAFSHSSQIVYEPQVGGKFALFDSNITGNFVELLANKRIVMNWRNKRWPDGHYSQATLDLEEKEDHTVLHLTQTGVPHSFVENTQDGWRNFYWNSIRSTFGFGSQLM